MSRFLLTAPCTWTIIIHSHSYWPDCNWCSPDKRRRNRLNDSTPYDMVSPPLLAPSADQRRVARREGAEGLLQIPKVGDEDLVPPPPRNSPTGVHDSLSTMTESSTGTPTATTATDNVIAGTPDPTLAKAKTMQAAPCSPSPTKSVPPSASKSLKLSRSISIDLNSDWHHCSMDVLPV